jgi:hypothetical protein
MTPTSCRPIPVPSRDTSVSADGLLIRRVETLAEYHECVDIQEETWG